ncbi:hypothetical protein DL766_002282 [Monosporascus sp. MC13-8B]|uniref:Ankyrin repeat protein n=1 Tax=Monosporascus cannonballus TaxID=155416 RepID=A0ABY0HK18_9PEZI|nr:hypothetical protein DL762_000179 [Monosporascus cannonballus]RYP35881.1 hypothetical protein DL766_002282 [Monosporascus sp. MC13-8B]
MKYKGYSLYPLTSSAQYAHGEVVESLLLNGANIESEDDSFGWTPLFCAAEEGKEAVIGLLIEKGADPNSKDMSGETPLTWAAKQGNEAVIQCLLEKGVDLEAKEKY